MAIPPTLTLAPADIPITEEIKMRCAEAGYPQPTKRDVDACLLNASKKALLRANWDMELVDWMRRAQEYKERDAARDRPSGGRMPVVAPAPYHAMAKLPPRPTELDIEANRQAALAALEQFNKAMGKKG